jgi:hypothetical protein
MATTSQMLARIVDLFGPAASADPTKLYGNLMVSPGGRVLIGTTTDNGTDDFQVIGTGSISGALKLTSTLTVSGASTFSSTFTVNAASTFSSPINATGGVIELGSITAVSSPFVDFHSSGVNQDFDGRLIVTGGTSGTVGQGTLTAQVAWLNVYNPSATLSNLKLQAGTYAPFIRSNSGNTSLEFVNSANTAVNMTLSDAGTLSLRANLAASAGEVRGNTVVSNNYLYAGGGTSYIDGGGNVYGTAWGGWLSSAIGAKMPTSGGNFTGVVTSSTEISAAHLRVTASYGTGGTGLSNQGVTLSWNDGNGDGAGYLAVNQGLGSGGWIIRTVNNANSSEIGRFTISGAGVGTNGSDKRLKKNIKTLKGALEKIRQIRGVSYTYRANGERHYGVIAQEVLPHFPDAVTVTHDMKRHKDILGVAYNDLIAPLIEAVKELADDLDAALARIAYLEAAIA